MLDNIPFYLSIGPQRAGTSWLDRYLRYRGDVCLPDGVKEVFFFDRHYHKGMEFYASHFNPKAAHRAAIEFTTTSFDDPAAPERVKETLGPDIKMICPLRDPISRSYSLYRHYKRYGLVKGSLKDACAQQPQILDSSHYANHLERWFDIFPAQHIHIQFQENLDRDQDQYVKEVCAFLNLPPIKIPDDLSAKYNATTKPPSSFLAKHAQSSAEFLRNHGLYTPINIAKRMGLKKVIFGTEGRGGETVSMTPEEEAFLTDHLGMQREKLSALLEQTYQKPLRAFLS